MNTDLDALLEALDAADTAVREIYRRLAEDPDRADEYEAGLRELRAKRAELARQAGMAALVQRRVSPSAMGTTTEPASTTEPSPPAVVAPATNGSASSAAAMRADPVSRASEPAPTAAASSPAPPPLLSKRRHPSRPQLRCHPLRSLLRPRVTPSSPRSGAGSSRRDSAQRRPLLRRRRPRRRCRDLGPSPCTR
jgi:hypothetical protein